MKRIFTVAIVVAIGISLMAAFNMAAAEEKGPVGRVATVATDTTKAVGNVAGKAVEAVTGTATTATQGVGQGKPVEAVTDTATTATKGVAGVAEDTVGAVSDTAQETTSSIFE